MDGRRSHRLRQNEERLRVGDSWKDRGLVFPNSTGNPIDHNNLYHREYKSLMGHSSIVQTMDTYSHLLDDFGGDAVGGLDEGTSPWV